jgi:uncharacterized protein (DUF983 family)
MTTDKLPRDLVQAMWRGFKCRCPACGEGRMFRAYLKVADECPACGEPLHHHRADDFPAYLVIVIAGHIVVPLILMVETDFHPAYWIHLALWLPLTLGLCLGLLQPVKGAVVALQWFLGMHGFEPAMKQRLALTRPATLEIRQSGV